MGDEHGEEEDAVVVRAGGNCTDVEDEVLEGI